MVVEHQIDIVILLFGVNVLLSYGKGIAKNFGRFDRMLFSRALSVKSVLEEIPRNSVTMGFLINSSFSF